ncbi:hypothetical protein Tco_1218144 [Tanacetum coccineum]
MGRDTIQLEDAVSTISGEYLLEFTLECGIPEGLHPELPGPEDTIVDFPEGKVGVYTKFFEFANYRILISQLLFDILGYYQIHLSQLSVIGAAKMDLFNLISALNQAKVKTGMRPHAAHEVPLLTAAASRVIEMEDPVAMSTSSETPFVMEKSPLDFSSEDPPPMITNKGETKDHAPAVASQEVPSAENTATTEVVLELNLEKDTTAKEPPVNKNRRKRDQSVVEGNAPPKVLRKDHASVHPAQDTRGGKSLAAIGLGPKPPSHTTVQQSISNPDPLSYAEPQPIPEQDVAQSSKIAAVVADPDFENTSFTSMIGSPGKLRHLPNDDFLSQYNINLARQVAMGSQLRLRFEQEAKLLKKSVAQVARQDQRIQDQVTGEERIKAAFKEFKKYEDDKVEQRCAEIDARLDKLSVDFNEELYPHMLKAIAGRRWVIGHGLRLAVMKCVESSEIRRAFADVVSAGLAKGISEGLRYGIEYGKAGRNLVDVEAYDPEANSKFVKALQDLKDLKYPMVDELERLKDDLVELIMASLHLESDTRVDALQWIRDLRLGSLQLKIPIYSEVRDPKDPWVVKEEMLLEDLIAANKSHAEKKKKCRVVCRTYRIGSAHHPRSDGIPVSAPTVVP